MFARSPMLAFGGAGGGGSPILRPQDVFATSLYTGNGTSQSINTGFAPDLVWVKTRNNANGGHAFFDRLRGAGQVIYSNTTGSELSRPDSLTAFNANGFSVGADTQTLAVNASGSTHAAWPIKRAAKFFDIVTYTGDGTSGRVIPHGLGIKPGLIIIKRRDADGFGWITYHASLGANLYLQLGTTGAQASSSAFYPAEPTSTGFTVGNGAAVNGSGGTYVAYLFAHDPDTANGIVQCGSFTTNGSEAASISLGWRPQWLLLKASSATSGWLILDTSRGFSASANQLLLANTSAAEVSDVGYIFPNSTGFTVDGGYGANRSYVFLAIRGPIT